jgi:protein-tyrosine phosphatase
MPVTDFHNHLMPSVDDGAQSLGESCEGLKAFEKEDVRFIITTPHLNGSLTLDRGALEARLTSLDHAWEELTVHARAHHPGVTLYRGVELMLDVPEPRLEDPRLRLAGGPFVLIEFPFMTVPPRSVQALTNIVQNGCRPILAHPERYNGFAPDYSLAEQWRKTGAALQVNGPSLLGKYGPDAREYAFGLLERGWVDYLSSDYHARGPTHVREYRGLLEEAGAGEQMLGLMETNPSRILTGEAAWPVPSMRVKNSLWDRVIGLFR